jgi:signal transduction histidine kinase/DNA-binding response OmpR family regulator/ligand-binding sensor domain-containing protein
MEVAMFRFFTHWIIVLLLFLLSSMVWAQFPSMIGFDRYDISDSEAEILGVFTDSRGFIWVSTESGAFRFDGREFLHIKKELAGTYVMDISEAPDGELWFATSGGITSLNTSAWEFTQYYHDPENPDSLGNSFVNDLHFDSKGRLWVAHDGGIDLMNTQTGKISHFGQNPENNANLQEGPWPGKIIEDEKGNFWVGYQNPVYIDRFNPGTSTFSRFDYRHPQKYIPNGYIKDLRPGNGKLWVSTTKDTGLYSIDLDSEEVTHYQHNSGDLSSIGAVNIYQSFIDRTGKIWMATDGGLDFFSADTGEFLHIPPDSDDNLKMKAPPRGITEDLSGNLWIVSFEGLYRTSLNNYMFQTIPTSLFVTGNLAEPSGEFWVTTLEEGPLHFNKNLTLSKHYQKDQSSWGMTYDNAGIPWGMAYDDTGIPWTSIVGQGPHQYDPQTDSFKLLPFGEYSEELRWAIVTNDSSGGTWFLSLTRAFQYKNNVLKPLTYNETDPDSGEKVQKEFIAWTVKNILVDSKERTWIGTSIGLYKVGQHQQGLSVYKADPLKEGTISNAQITGIVQSKNEDVWISTMQGLNRYLPETDTFEIVDTNDGLPSDGITSMVVDESGILWLGTARGIIRFDPDSRDISVFGPEHGAFIGGGIVTGSFGSDGRIYMGGPIGITRFDPAEIRKSTFTPPVQLLGLQLTDSQEGSLSKQTTPDELNLPWTNESFTMEFSAMDLTKPESVKYRIRLNGWDNDWIELGNDNSIRYTNIPGGSYEFLVNATNADGVWTTEDKWARMNIHIATHPLKTPGAVMSYIFLGFALITGIFMRYRAIQRKKLLQEQFISDRLRNVDRLKDEFLANTTHELRTPLNGIIGIAESLIDETGETVSSGTKKELSLIASSGRRLSCLINDILDFSRLKKGDIEIQKDRVDISRLVNTVLVLSRPLCSGKSLELINDVPADLPAAVGDVNRIQQIFHNLVGNAIKFTPEGSVTVSASADSKDFIEITVSDTGPGIPIAKQEEIWLSFRQADASASRDAGGTGLGLPITRRLVELHGGSIRLESEGRKGAAFIFTLPVAGDAAAPAGLRTVASVRDFPGNLSENVGTSIESTLPSVNLPRILYVDDEAINRHVVEQQLKESPYTLSLASTGEEALKQIEKGRRPDLILLDIMMPGMDGYEVCRSIRQKYSPNDLPIIMVTAKNQVADLVEGLSAGANDFISKPCSREELLARIDRHRDVARTHAFYGRFVPKDILGLLEKSDANSLESGTHTEKQMTLLLADFAGNPLIKQSETFAFLSSFLPKVLPVIRENQGIIYRYEGEGVISFFPGSPSKALESSIGIQRLTAEYNTEHRLRGKRAVQINTVLHRGKFIIGTAGDYKFTGEVVLSDALNQILYLRDLARRFSAPVLATESVTLEMNGDFRKRLVAFLNHDSNYGVYEILAGDPRDIDPKIQSLEDFERGIQLFYGSRFDEASVQFGKVLKLNPQDMAAVLHRNRCAYYLTNEPDKEPEIFI